MNHLEIIQRILKEGRSLDELPATGLPFLTISRQAGAGGHLFAYAILTEFLKHEQEQLFQGWHVFDKQLCEVIAQDPQIQESIEALSRERFRPEFRDFVESLFTGQSSQYTLYKTSFKVARMLALLGKVIVVGRAAVMVTADLRQGIHIRLVAPESRRVVWMMERFKLTQEEAKVAIAKQDSDRRKLIQMFFQRDIEDPLLYDAVWNTGKVGIDTICTATIDLIRSRAAAKAARAARR